MLSKCSINISNGIPLLFSQSCGISAVPSEEQPPQIGHLPAHERKQLPGNLLSKKGPLDFRGPFSELAVFS